MASFWSNVVDVLRSPAFRIGSGVAGLASGAGAFEDLGGWGQALSGLSGLANVGAGAASAFGPDRSTLDKITGGLQIGLGGYNIGQGLGAVGTFGDIYDSLSGGSSAGGGTTAIGGATAGDSGTTGAGFGESYGGPVTTGMAPTTDASIAPLATSALPAATGYVDPNQSAGLSLVGGDTPGSDTFSSSVEDAPITPQPRPGQGWPAAATTPTPAPAAAAPPTSPPPALAPLPAPITVPPAPGANLPVTAAGTPATPFAGSGISAVQPVSAAVLGPGAGTQAQGPWLDRAWTSLANAAASNPVGAAMAAVQVGGMLTQMFAASKADIAADVLKELKASQPTPEAAPDGTEFRRLYAERANRMINDQYATTLSGLEAKFAARGMLRSTVYTNAVAALEKAKADNVANIETNAYTAWNQALREWTAAASVTNQTAKQQADNLSAVSSYVNATTQNMDFSNMTRILAGSPFAQSAAANQARTQA
jgi:hypothetical protein